MWKTKKTLIYQGLKIFCFYKIIVREAGFEPITPALTVLCSAVELQDSMVLTGGNAPPSSVLQTDVLLLN